MYSPNFRDNRKDRAWEIVESAEIDWMKAKAVFLNLFLLQVPVVDTFLKCCHGQNNFFYQRKKKFTAYSRCTLKNISIPGEMAFKSRRLRNTRLEHKSFKYFC